MGFAIRPLLARVSTAYDEAGRVPGGWVALIFAGVLLSAYATEQIGIALIFGAFVMGLIMPRRAELTEDVTRRIEDFVVTLLLPLFFAYTGPADQRRPARPAGAVAAHAACCWPWPWSASSFGATIAARLTGFDWRPAAVIGTLMNTRGLTELIVLNLALELGRHLRGAVRDARADGARHHLHGGPGAQAARPQERARRARSRRSSRRPASSRSSEFPALPPPEESILVAPQSDGALRAAAGARRAARPLASRRAS